MKRAELKFRAWDGDRMIFFSDLEIGLIGTGKGNRRKTSPRVGFSKDTFDGTVKLTSHKVMQYSGLTDKNGKDVYEGDIVKATFYNHSMPDSEFIQQIVFENGCFCSKHKDTEIDADRTFAPLYQFFHPTANKIEVIGNIFENPDLKIFEHE